VEGRKRDRHIYSVWYIIHILHSIHNIYFIIDRMNLHRLDFSFSGSFFLFLNPLRKNVGKQNRAKLADGGISELAVCLKRLN